MNIDYFGAAEATLYELPDLKRSVPILEARLKRLIEAGAPSEPVGIDLTARYVSSSYSNAILNEQLAIVETRRELAATVAEVHEIERAFSSLPEEQQAVLRLYYLEKRTAEEIAERIYVESAKTVYNIRNRGVFAFALIYFGAAAKKGRKRGKK